MTKPLFALFALFCFAAASQTAAANLNTVSPTDKNLHYLGRWDKTDQTSYHGNWIGSYVRATWTGTSIGVTLKTHTDMDAAIDGEPMRVVRGGSGVTQLNLAPLAPGIHTVLVGVKGGGGWDFEGLVLDAGAVTRPSVKKPIIEFIGDSITTGSFGPLEAAGNYNWLAAQALDCDHTQISWPGRALTTGYGCQDDKRGLDTQYFQRKCFYDSGPDVPWDFAINAPQIVVINLGQNDGCGQEPDNVFTASYTHFLESIRAKLPQAQIVALRMFGGDRFGRDTQQAVATRKANGDSRVHFFDTEGWLAPTDFADGVHPNEAGNVKAAIRLAPLLRPLLVGKNTLAATRSVTVGDPKDPAGLPQAVQEAYIGGARHITIKPGTYLLPDHGHNIFTMEGWRDTVVSAYGVTLIIVNGANNGRLFEFSHCTNVTLAGPLLSQTAITAYQGHVTAIGKDDQGNATCDWRPSAGYPKPPTDLKELWINVIDAKTRTFKIGVGDYYHPRLESLGDGSFRFHFESAPLKFGRGDWIVARYGNPPNKVGLDDCRNCTLQDLTLMRNGFAPIFESAGGGNHVLRCHWALGPRPRGASEAPVVTNAADGLHSVNAGPGPDIEGCTFEGVFLDDCIAIHGSFHKITTISGPMLTVKNDYAYFAVGEPVRISNDHGFYMQATVVTLKDNQNGTSTLTLDTSEKVPSDACLSTPLHDGGGYKIVGCRLGSTRSRGIIVKGDNGLIKDNVITHCGEAISIGPEWPDEADYCHNVTVEGNTCVENGLLGFDPAILIHGSGAPQNRALTLRNNHFISNYGGDMHIDWADGVLVVGNTSQAPVTWPPGSKPKPSISVSNSQNTVVRGSASL